MSSLSNSFPDCATVDEIYGVTQSSNELQWQALKFQIECPCPSGKCITKITCPNVPFTCLKYIKPMQLMWKSEILSRPSDKSCRQCSKLLPVCQPEADNFGGGPGTFWKLFFNFMFMIWDSRQQDGLTTFLVEFWTLLQVFHLSYCHFYSSQTIRRVKFEPWVTWLQDGAPG